MDQDAFHQLWGTAGVAPAAPADDSTTRSLDPKAFENVWLKPTDQTSNPVVPSPEATSAASGFIEGIPIVGPYIKSGVEKAAAKARSMRDNTKYEDELALVQRANALAAQDHPNLNTAGQVAGAIGPMVAGAGLAPRAFGMVGPLAERMAFGAGSNALINSADTAARGGSFDDAVHSGGIGGTIGAGLPVAGKVLGAAGRYLLSPPRDAATNALVQRAADLGIPLRPAQISTSPFVNKMDQMVAKIPGSGMGALVNEQHVGLNRAAARTFGEDAERITPDVMAAAKKRIGSEFDTVEKNTNVRFDNTLGSKLGGVLHDASSVLEPDQVAPLAKRVTEISNLAKGGVFDGKTFNNMMKKDAPLSRLQQSTDPNVKFYAGQIRDSLRDALERSATPEMAQRYNIARYQYKNMKTIEPLAGKAATGDISPLLLLNEVRKANPNFAYGSGGDIADIARIGQRFMKQPPDSGTPLGTKVLDLFARGGGTLASGALGGAGYAYSQGGSPFEDVGLGLAGLAAAGMGARGATTLLNRPAALNALFQRVPAALPAYNQLQLSQQR